MPESALVVSFVIDDEALTAAAVCVEELEDAPVLGELDIFVGELDVVDDAVGAFSF